MWIRSQDKRQMLNVTGLGISRVFGGKKKGAITAYMSSTASLDSYNFVVAQYETQEDAMDEMNRFQEHLETSPNSIFELR